MKQELKWGIIGLGRFGKIHANVLNDLPGSLLHSVCGRNPDRIKEDADSLGVSFTSDYREMLDDPEVDVISIVTHWREHFEIALDALQAGKHVFLEKPMAATGSQCDELVEAAAKSDGNLMVGHICRFDPRVTAARDAINSGRIGKIVSMHAKRNLPKAPGNIRLNKISPFLGDGIHDADLMMWFLDQTPTKVYGKNIRIGNDFTYPDLGWAMLHFGDSAIGVVETVWCLPENVPTTIDAKFEIIGTKGTIMIDCSNTGVTILDEQGPKMPDTVYWPVVYGVQSGALARELGYFADCVRAGKKPEVITPEEAARAVHVMETAEMSAKSGVPEEIVT